MSFRISISGGGGGSYRFDIRYGYGIGHQPPEIGYIQRLWDEVEALNVVTTDAVFEYLCGFTPSSDGDGWVAELDDLSFSVPESIWHDCVFAMRRSWPHLRAILPEQIRHYRLITIKAALRAIILGEFGSWIPGAAGPDLSVYREALDVAARRGRAA